MPQKAKYVRKLNKSSFTLTAEKGFETESDRIEMFHYNNIPYFLKMETHQENMNLKCCYDITSKRSLEQLLKYKTLNLLLLQKILRSFDQACIQAENYMLTENDILLEPEFIFAESDCDQMFYCYFPGNQLEIHRQFQKLMEYLLQRIDHKDEQAVQLAYGVHQQVAIDQAALHTVLTNIEKVSGISYISQNKQPSKTEPLYNKQMPQMKPISNQMSQIMPTFNQTPLSKISQKNTQPSQSKTLQNNNQTLQTKPSQTNNQTSQSEELQNNKNMRKTVLLQHNNRMLHLNSLIHDIHITQPKQSQYNEELPQSIHLQPNPHLLQPQQLQFDPHLPQPEQSQFDPHLLRPQQLQFDPHLPQPEQSQFDPHLLQPQQLQFDPHLPRPQQSQFDSCLSLSQSEQSQFNHRLSIPEQPQLDCHLSIPEQPQFDCHLSIPEDRKIFKIGRKSSKTDAFSKQNKDQQKKSPSFKKKDTLKIQTAEKIKNFLHNKIYTNGSKYMEDEPFFESDSEEAITSNPTVCLIQDAEAIQNQFIYQGADRTRDFCCTGKKMILGSNIKDSDIYIPLPMISRVHALIEINEQGTFLEDMNSTNGTHVNGELLQYRERRMLQKGDIISLAGECYSFH